MKTINKILGILVCICSAMVGYRVNEINGSSCAGVWAFVDFFFWPVAWIKWLIFHEVTWAIIKHTFAFFSISRIAKLGTRVTRPSEN